MKILTILLTLFFLIGCSSKNEEIIKQTNLTETPKKEAEPVYPDFCFDTLVGSYEGDFAGSPIRININFTSNKHATGYNIHKGLVRNISGKITEDSNSVFLTLAEPGENEFDGVFHLTVNREDLKMSGTWTPNDENLTEKSFDLERYTPINSIDKPHLQAKSDFLEYMGSIGDSLADINFEQDGLVICSHYPNGINELENSQLIEVFGNWSLINDTTISVSWEKNDVFPNRESTFHLMEEKYEHYTRIFLQLDERKLYTNY